MLQVINLSYKHILRKVTFEYDSGVFAVIGKNGSGKTTLAKSIMGILPSTGKIMFEGKEISSLSITDRANLGITLAFQNPAEFEGVRVKELFSLLTDSLDDMKLILSKVGLPEKILDKNIHTLSGGERKRIELASVLLMKPKLAILDEPDSGIDVVSYPLIKDVINSLNNVILITHNPDLARMASKGILLSKGEVVAQGDVDMLLELMNK